MFSKQFAGVLLVIIVIAWAVSAEEKEGVGANVTEVRIESLTTKVDAGDVLNYSFLVGNRIGLPCNSLVEYWVGTETMKINGGEDTIFLDEGETKKVSSFLLIPDEPMGIQGFFIRMKCNGSVVMASKPIKIIRPIPAMLEFGSLDVYGGNESNSIDFSYVLKSSRSDTLPILLEELIVNDGNVVWTNSRESFVSFSDSFNKRSPFLLPGNYELVVRATHGEKTAEIRRGFVVSGTPGVLPFGLLEHSNQIYSKLVYSYYPVYKEKLDADCWAFRQVAEDIELNLVLSIKYLPDFTTMQRFLKVLSEQLFKGLAGA